MQQKKVHFYLTNPNNDSLRLSYEVRGDEIGEIWYRCLQTAVPHGMMDDHRFLNFSKDQVKELSNLLFALEANIKKLRAYHPELDIPDPDVSQLQQSINHLHQKFGHLHLDKSIVLHPESLPYWHQFNTLLHAMEFLKGGASYLEQNKFPEAYQRNIYK